MEKSAEPGKGAYVNLLLAAAPFLEQGMAEGAGIMAIELDPVTLLNLRGHRSPAGDTYVVIAAGERNVLLMKRAMEIAQREQIN